MTSQQSRPPLAIEFLPQRPALDIIALMDALKIEKAVLAGFDWGARTAGALAAAVQGAGLGARLSVGVRRDLTLRRNRRFGNGMVRTTYDVIRHEES